MIALPGLEDGQEVSVLAFYSSDRVRILLKCARIAWKEQKLTKRGREIIVCEGAFLLADKEKFFALNAPVWTRINPSLVSLFEKQKQTK